MYFCNILYIHIVYLNVGRYVYLNLLMIIHIQTPFFSRQVSLDSPEYPGTCSVDQANLEPKDPPA